PKPVRYVPVMSRVSPDGTNAPPFSASHHVWCRVYAFPCPEAGEPQIVLRRETSWQGVPASLGGAPVFTESLGEAMGCDQPAKGGRTPATRLREGESPPFSFSPDCLAA